MYVCMYGYTYTYRCACAGAYAHGHGHMHMHEHLHVHVFMYLHVHSANDSNKTVQCNVMRYCVTCVYWSSATVCRLRGRQRPRHGRQVQERSELCLCRVR